MPRIAINGLGRIGRAAFKILLGHPDLDLVAVNDLVPPDNLAYLLNFDTVYGRYEKKVTVEDGHLVVNGNKIPVYKVKDPAELPRSDQNIDLVLECAGAFTRKEQYRNILRQGPDGSCCLHRLKGMRLSRLSLE